MSELKNTFAAAFPQLETSPTAQGRVCEAGRLFDLQNHHRQQVRSRTRLSLGVGLASAVILGGLVLFPTNSAAAYLRHVRQVITDARSAHMIEWSVMPDGSRKIQREIWYQNGSWRVDAPMFADVTISDGEQKWVYSPDRKSVRLSRDGGAFFGHNRGFTLTSMIADSRGNKLDIDEQGPYKRVRIVNRIDNAAITMWVDPKTDYPVRGQVESQTPHGRQTIMVVEFEFNKPVASTLFKPTFPAGTKIVDESDGKAYWERELSKEASRHSFKLMYRNQEIIVRNLQTTERGDVFLLYTGETAHNALTLTDDLGNVYAPCEGFQPQMDSMDMETHKTTPAKGIVVGGRPLNGGWWTLARPESGPWRPRTLTFTVVDDHFVADPVKMRNWPRDKMVKQSDMTEVKTIVGTWTKRVEEPSSSSIPDYMPYMAMGPTDEFSVDREDARARAEYLVARGRYADAEPFQRAEIRRLQDFEARTGQRWVKSHEFFQMYTILKHLDRAAEAKEWLRKVLDEPNGAHSDEAILKALRDEGLH